MLVLLLFRQGCLTMSSIAAEQVLIYTFLIRRFMLHHHLRYRYLIIVSQLVVVLNHILRKLYTRYLYYLLHARPSAHSRSSLVFSLAASASLPARSPRTAASDTGATLVLASRPPRRPLRAAMLTRSAPSLATCRMLLSELQRMVGADICS